MPCVEGLFPGAMDTCVQVLLWTYACWHALAKSRVHTETTVEILEDFTRTLGQTTRQFATACDSLDTRELPSEEAARGRREARNVVASRTKVSI